MIEPIVLPIMNQLVGSLRGRSLKC
jgi:hypothetical protein